MSFHPLRKVNPKLRLFLVFGLNLRSNTFIFFNLAKSPSTPLAMGFRFFGFNSFERSYSYLSRISPKPHKNSIFAHYNPLTIQAIGTQFQLEGIYCPSNPPNSHIFKRWHFGHSHHDHHHHHGPLQGSSKESENIFRLGLAADVGLTVGKAVTGYLSGSTAIIADAAHSLSDVVGKGLVQYD